MATNTGGGGYRTIKDKDPNQTANETENLERLLLEAGNGPPDIREETSNVNQSHMTTERFVRTEVAPDGSLLVYKKGEFRMPNGDVYIGETLNEKRNGKY